MRCRVLDQNPEELFPTHTEILAKKRSCLLANQQCRGISICAQVVLRHGQLCARTVIMIQLTGQILKSATLRFCVPDINGVYSDRCM